MAKQSIIAARSAISQPNVASTNKDQKRFEQGSDYNPQQLNAELDYIHERINKIVVEASALADLATDGTSSNSEICTRINALTEILRNSGLLRRS